MVNFNEMKVKCEVVHEFVMQFIIDKHKQKLKYIGT